MTLLENPITYPDDRAYVAWTPETPEPGGAAPSAVDDVLDQIVKQWVHIAVSHSRVRLVETALFIADVVGVDGVWASGSTADEALAELPSVLYEWARMKLADGDPDIPRMEGVALVIEE